MAVENKGILIVFANKNQHNLCILASKETSNSYWLINLIKTQPANNKKGACLIYFSNLNERLKFNSHIFVPIIVRIIYQKFQKD